MADVIRLTGSDTITINGVILADFPAGEIGKLTFPTDISAVKTGKNGNAVIAINESGNQATLELRVLRGGIDDKLLDTLVTLYLSDSSKFVLMTGSVAKTLGTGVGTAIGVDTPVSAMDGVVAVDSYALSGGVPTKKVEVVSNVEGDVEQAVAKYTFQFVRAARSV